MSLYIQGMSSCAVQEIACLGYHSSPEDAMMAFCRQTIKNSPDCSKNGGYSVYTYGQTPEGNQGHYTQGLGENYVFHGVEDSSFNTGYASRFAKFIEENKLGVVFGGEKVNNHRYHPDHKTQVFVWNPDRAAVFAWRDAHMLPPAALKPPVPQPPVVLPEPAASPIKPKAGEVAKKKNVPILEGM